MTAAMPGLQVPRDVPQTVKRMQAEARKCGRDEAMHRVLAVRRGQFSLVWPDKFNDEFPTAIVANFVDQAARDMAASLSPLPSLRCSAGRMVSEADKRRAERKNRIGYDFWLHSRLQTQMKYGSDQYLTYGFLPFRVEPDYDARKPRINLEDPTGCYYDLNRHLECLRFARCWKASIQELAAQFPEYADRILYNEHGQPYETQDTEVVRYTDDQSDILYLPERGNLVVASTKHGMNFCPVHIALRPGVEVNPRGAFDDVLWVQLAHTVLAALTLEAGHKAVQAPIAVPNDVNEIAIGPDAVIQTDHPENVKRVALDVPAAAFALSEQLSQEMHSGAGYPDSRLGVGPTGGSTGAGVNALQIGFDGQIRLGQDVIGEAVKCATEMCFKMAAKLWPNVMQTITGTISGESFQLTYRASEEDLTSTVCAVSYGFASGANTTQQIITLLQLRGDEIIGRDTFRRQLPFDIDVDQQQRELDEQALADAAMQGLAAALQASGQMFAQGQGQEAVMFFDAAVKMIRGRRQGKDMADLIEEVFIQPAQQAQQQQADAQQAAPDQSGAPGGAPGAPPGPGDLAGVGANGLLPGVAPGQAGLAPGGRPSIQDLTAGITGSGTPSLGATVRRRLPAG